MSKSESSAPQPFSTNWLKNFMLGLCATAGTIALLLWLYSLWGYLAVVSPSREGLATEDDAGLKEAVVALASPHIFSGYEPYHGFGTPKGKKRSERIDAIVARGEPYSEDELAYLIRQVAYFVPAFIKHKVDGQVTVLPGDRAVTRTLLERWENALANGMALAIHLTIVALMFSGLFLAYLKLGHFRRLAARPPATQ